MEYTAISNPFAVLTAVVAPAVLTNASSVLTMRTGNRVARVMDRTRMVMAELDTLEPGSPHYQAWAAQLVPLQVRAHTLLKALRCFYAALGLFASTGLISVAGSIAAYYGVTLLFEASVAGCTVHRLLRCGRIGLRMRAHGAGNPNRLELPRRRGKNPCRIPTFQAKMKPAFGWICH